VTQAAVHHSALSTHHSAAATPPLWIQDHPTYARLGPGPRATLAAIAAACHRQTTAGDLLGAFGGAALADAAGCSRATLWRHISRLEALGFVVALARGGVIGGRSYANQYGIPGAPGSLDHRKCRRRLTRMVAGADGVLRPQTITPGNTPTLWPQSEPEQEGEAPSQNEARLTDEPSLKMRRPPSQNEAPSGKRRNGNDHDHGPRIASGGGGLRHQAGRRPRGLGHVDDRDLRELPRLRGLFDRAVAGGYVTDSERDRLQFVAAAEHALRVAYKPAALFASMVRQGRWLFISQADEDAARRRIAQARARSIPNEDRRQATTRAGVGVVPAEVWK
jgi:hypothetical protein